MGSLSGDTLTITDLVWVRVSSQRRNGDEYHHNPITTKIMLAHFNASCRTSAACAKSTRQPVAMLLCLDQPLFHRPEAVLRRYTLPPREHTRSLKAAAGETPARFLALPPDQSRSGARLQQEYRARDPPGSLARPCLLGKRLIQLSGNHLPFAINQISQPEFLGYAN